MMAIIALKEALFEMTLIKFCQGKLLSNAIRVEIPGVTPTIFKNIFHSR
jgi:hypothetical protein